MKTLKEKQGGEKKEKEDVTGDSVTHSFVELRR